ncbi:DUF4864 domain-containing protein [Pseudosulfitobacter sp. SM2401]|uniref:DUF4864 domain-containing protein n=1 Tax=Pseudosulfitobacter sp. SM2401 TaxID=3350098 RepID=UPI0036F3C6FC
MFRTLRVTIFAAAFAVSGMVALDARAQGADIQTTISRQIEALQMDDFAGAFEFASPNIQRIFGSSDNFGQMVTRGYPMVWRPADVTYLDLAEIDGDLWQKVLIKDQQDRLHVLGYRMLETDTGWKINGVQLLPQPDVAA